MKEEVARGEFTPTYKYDILCKATDAYDHPGRVRGYSTHTCHREVFGDNSGEFVERSRYKKLEKELEMTKLAFTKELEMTRETMIKGFKMFGKKCGMTLPNNLDDINSDWEPPSSGSHHSPPKVHIHHNDPQEEPEYDGMEEDFTTPKVVSFFNIYYFSYIQFHVVSNFKNIHYI